MISKIAILSDIHGNLPALRAVLEDIQSEKCTKVFVLGDIINGIDPQGSVQYLREWRERVGIELICIKGNAESYLLTPDRHSLPIQNEEWHMNVVRLIQWYEDQLSEENINWIKAFPITYRWRDAYFVHDSPHDRKEVEETSRAIAPEYREWYYHGKGILPGMDNKKWEKLLEYMEVEKIKQVYCGHTHVPFFKEFGDKRICNVGSVGVPVDGDPRAAWGMLMENSNGNKTVTIRRVAYEISEILQKIDETPEYPDFQTSGIREAYKKWFLTGVFWRVHHKDEQR
jgi:predicted phosphodiesterase